MTILNSRLILASGASVLALLAAVPASAQSTAARPAAVSAESPSQVEEVVVTGTRIRGVAPVGSSVIGVGQEQIEKSGVASVVDVLRQVPQVTNYGADDTLTGGTSVQNSILNITLARSINLRGLGTTATLSLVNGHRVAPGGVNASLFDADSIPAGFVQRIEVVADGASAIYGSDAVAGVVNYVMRPDFDGLQTTVRLGGYDGSSNSMATIVGGRRWDTGGFALSFERAHKDALKASDRSAFYNDDLTPYGGTAGAVQSSPGNITIGTTVYAVPKGQNGQALRLSQLSSPGIQNYQSVWKGTDAIPEQDRYSIAGTIHQQLSDKIELFGEGFFSRRDFSRRSVAAVGNSLSVPGTNPYNPCNAVNPQANTQGIVCSGQAVRVNYSFLNDLGPSVLKGYEEAFAATAGAKFDLPLEWKGEFSYTRSESKELRRSFNQVNSAALTNALNPTTAAAAGIAPLNLFCDGTAFSSCNAAGTLDYFRGTVEAGSTYKLNDYNLKFDGRLFSLPGGLVRLAFGGEYHDDNLTNYNANNTTTTGVGIWTSVTPSISRNVRSFFGELYVPIVGPDNAMPGLQKLEVVIAGRTEKYSDFGSTRNPKIGVNWTPVDGYRVHGSYGTSFRAPTLCDINADCTVRYLNTTISAPDLTAVGLTGAGRTYFLLGGGLPGLQPETAKTWSLGADFSPRGIPGLTGSLNYYAIKYENRIDTPGQNANFVTNLTDANYARFVTFNPTFFPTQAAASGTTQAAFNTLVNSYVTSSRYTGGPVNQATVVAIVDGRRQNSGSLKTDGIDFVAAYRWDGLGGEWNIGASGNYVLNYTTAPVPNAALVDQNNKFGYTLKFKARGELGWSRDGLSISGFVNYANPYHLGREYTLPAAAAQYLDVDAFTTFDLTASYAFKSGGPFNALADTRLSLSVQNLTDEDPPFVLNASSSPIQFDPSNASVLGRIWSVQLSKKW